jgi:DNA-binding LacI/PurR family transcriptional regulator
MAQDTTVTDNTIVIGVTFPASTDMFWMNFKQEMALQAEKFEIEILIREADSLETQRSDIDDFLARPVDGMLVYPVVADVADLGISTLQNLTSPPLPDASDETDAADFAKRLLLPLIYSINHQRAGVVSFEPEPPHPAPRGVQSQKPSWISWLKDIAESISQ